MPNRPNGPSGRPQQPPAAPAQQPQQPAQQGPNPAPQAQGGPVPPIAPVAPAPPARPPIPRRAPGGLPPMPPIGGLPTRPQRSPLEVTVDWVRSNPRLTAILAMLALAAAAGTVAVTGYQRSRREYDATVELADRERELKERPRRTIAVDGSIFKPSATSPTPTAGLSSGTAVIDGTGKLYPATVEVVKCAPLGTQFTVRLKVTVQAPGGPVDYETQDFLVQIPGAHAGFSDHATLTQ